MGRTTPTSRAAPGAEQFLPPAPDSLPALTEAVHQCRGCDLYQRATQGVFGEGDPHAPMMLVGEQPGDQEDRQGHPFVGPAGAVLSQALADAGIDRAHVYITNAVKHFNWVPSPRGKRRMHSKPLMRHVNACRPWLEHEIRAVHPRVIVLLGATAAQSLLGSAFRVSKERGRVITGTAWAPALMPTFHPSAILRADENRDAMYAQFVADLRSAGQAIHSPTKGA